MSFTPTTLVVSSIGSHPEKMHTNDFAIQGTERRGMARPALAAMALSDAHMKRREKNSCVSTSCLKPCHTCNVTQEAELTVIVCHWRCTRIGWITTREVE